jgi:hypothetical protein
LLLPQKLLTARCLTEATRNASGIMVDQHKRDPANEQSSIGSAANNRTSAEYAAAESMPLGRRSKPSSRPKSGREGGQTALQRQAAAAALAAQTAAAAAAAAASAAAAAAAAAAAEAAADKEAYKPARPRSVEDSHRPSRHRTGSEPNSYKKKSTKSLQGPVLAKVGSAPEMLHSVELEVSTLNTMQEGELGDSVRAIPLPDQNPPWLSSSHPD